MNEPGDDVSLKRIERRLAGLDRRLRRLQVVRGAGQTLLAASVCAGGALLIDLAWDLSSPVRTMLLAIVAAVTIVVAWRSLLPAWIGRRSRAELAALVESSFPQFRERLTTAVELRDSPLAEALKGSPVMREVLGRETAAAADGLDFGAAVSSRRSVRWGAAGLLCVAALLLPLAAVPQQYGILWRRLLQSWQGEEGAVGALFAEQRTPAVGAVDADLLVPPRVERITLDVKPPEYTGLPAETRVVAGAVTVVEGSLLTVRVEFNKPVASARLHWLDDEEHAQPMLPLGDRRTVVAVLPAEREGPLAMTGTDTAGNASADPAVAVTLVHDQPPQLLSEGEESAEPWRVRPDDVLRIPVRAADDFGISAIDLRAEIAPGVTHVVSAASLSEPTRVAAAEIVWNLAPHRLPEGSVLRYRLHAVDNRPVPGPNETWSETRFLLIDRAAPPGSGDPVTRRQEQLRSRMESLRKEAAATVDEIEAHRQAGETQSGASTENGPGNRWGALSGDQAGAANRLQELARELRDRPLYLALAREAADVAERDFREAGLRLSAAANSAPALQSQPLDEAVARLTSARDRLQRLIERFDELAAAERDLLQIPFLAQRMDALAGQARALRQREQGESTASATNRTPGEPAPSTPRDGAAIERLKRQREEIAREVDSLLAEHPPLLETARKVELARLAEISGRLEVLAAREEALRPAIEEDAAAGARHPGAETDEVEPLQAALQHEVRVAVDAAATIIDRAGGEAETARNAVELARRVEGAAQAAWSGRLAHSGELVKQAAKFAGTLIDSLKADEDARGHAAAVRNLEALAERLTPLAEGLSRASESPTKRRGARLSGQRLLAGQAADLAQGLAEIADAFADGALQFDRPHTGADQARRGTEGALAEMREGLAHIERSEDTAALTPVTAAGRLLREAARWAREGAAAGGALAAAVPEDLAARLAEAAQQLEQAERALAEHEEGASAAQNAAAAPSNADEQADDADRDDALGRTADAIERSARALRQASMNLRPGGVPGQGSDSGAAASNATPGSALSGSAGTGAWGLRDVEWLEGHLERHARREWGRLPRAARGEVNESSEDRSPGEYGEIIREYFRALAEPRK